MLNETFHIGETSAKTRLETYILDTYREGDLRPLVIVCPGGGFLACSPYEGEPVAVAFNRAGYHAAVLTYSTEESNPGRSAFPQPLCDLADAIRLVRKHTVEWHVNPDRIVVLGFSAGGQVCASYGNLWSEDLLQGHGTPAERQPNAVVLGYPMLDVRSLGQSGRAGTLDLRQVTGQEASTRYEEFFRRSRLASLGDDPNDETLHLASPLETVGTKTPPTFIWTTFGDQLIDPAQDLAYARRLHEAGVPCELHVFAEGEHGLALADRTCARKPKHIDAHVAHWIELTIEWLDCQAFEG